MLKSALPVVAALGLAALAGQAVTRAPAPAEPAAGWHLLREGRLAKLAYGLADSDQVAIMLTCAPGDRSAVVYGDVQPRAPSLQLASAGPAPVDPLSDGEAYEMTVALSDPGLQDLARGPGLAVRTEAGSRHLTATRSEQRLVRGFLDYCASGRA